MDKYIVELLEPVRYGKKSYTVGDRLSVNEEEKEEIIKKKVGFEIKLPQPPIEPHNPDEDEEPTGEPENNGHTEDEDEAGEEANEEEETEESPNNEESQQPGESTAIDYEDVKYNQLRSMAKEKGINLGKTPGRDELINALQAIEGE